MNFSGIFARIVALIGGAALLWRRGQGAAPEPAWGSAPVIPEAKPQGAIPTLKMPTARGWAEGETPQAAPGLKVNAFATGLDHRKKKARSHVGIPVERTRNQQGPGSLGRGRISLQNH